MVYFIYLLLDLLTIYKNLRFTIVYLMSIRAFLIYSFIGYSGGYKVLVLNFEKLVGEYFPYHTNGLEYG